LFTAVIGGVYFWFICDHFILWAKLSLSSPYNRICLLFFIIDYIDLVLTIGFVSLIGAAEIDKASEIELLVTVTVDVVVAVAAAEINKVTALLSGEL